MNRHHKHVTIGIMVSLVLLALVLAGCKTNTPTSTPEKQGSTLSVLQTPGNQATPVAGDPPVETAVAPAPVNHQEAFPLALGNRWVYEGKFYSGSTTADVLEATYVVTETIVDVLRSAAAGLDLYQVAREITVTSCPEAWQKQPDNWCERIMLPEAEYTWLAMDGNTLYKLHRLEAYRLAEMATNELVFPLDRDAQWYLTRAMAEANPNFEVDAMLRKVTLAGSVHLPSGDFDDCYRLGDVTGGSISSLTYCSGVGIVEQGSTHSGTPFGGQEILISYTLVE